jgi:plastocyanin
MEIEMPRKLAWLFFAAIVFSQKAQAQSWQLQVGAQSGDKAHQALAFLPNEIWIHQNDSITWTFSVNEIHTVTFLTAAQPRPSRLAGCPGSTPDFSVFDGSACVNSGVVSNSSDLSSPPTYTVVFPATGNFKLVCLAHPNMTATIHVLAPSDALPHDQGFYDHEANRQRADLLAGAQASAHVHTEGNTIVAGAGKIIGTAGGTETASVMRFMDANRVIHVGETVEWITSEAVTSHTITFGPEPDLLHQIPPSANVTVDEDGARHAVLNSPSDVVHSGFITQAPQDRTNLPQSPVSTTVTRFRATFTGPGVYHYICVLHDGLGMVGDIVVLP